jgi:hypothetical protein
MLDGQHQKRSDLDAHDWVTGLTIHQAVRELARILGATTVAVIGGVKEARAVQQWMADREPQRPHVIRFALQLATMLADGAGGEFAKAWFHAANPRLDDRIPMFMLRDLPLEDVQAPMLRAARAFAARNAGDSS